MSHQHQARPDGAGRPKPRKHLMDPNAPRPVRNTEVEMRSLSHVQQWVMSVLVVTTILHLSAGFVLAAMFLPDPTRYAEIGLNIIAGACGVMAVAAGLAIHKRHIVSWWLLLGGIPTVAGLWLTLS